MYHQTIPNRCDCDDPTHSQSLLDIPSAVALALSLVSPTAASRSVSLSSSLGHICAEDILSAQEMPSFDNSAMDGFAVRCHDLEATRTLSICGTVAAGQIPRALAAGSAMRIFTGAPIPEGADAVIKVEESSEAQNHVSFRCAPPHQGQNIRARGSDQHCGACLIRKGQKIATHHLGLLAAQGVRDLRVVCSPRVAVASTGDELGTTAETDARIHDANRPMLIAMAAAMGAEVIDLGIIPDDPGATASTLARSVGTCDLILTSGAVSMGGKDHLRATVMLAGGKVDGWRVAVKPGKPVIFGRLGPTVITGLPGNPFAAFVGFHLFAAPQIRKLLGAAQQPILNTPAEADFPWNRKPGRAEVFPVRLTGYSSTGLPRLERLGHSVSGTLLPLAQADGLALVPSDTSEVAPGDRLLWHPFANAGEAS